MPTAGRSLNLLFKLLPILFIALLAIFIPRRTQLLSHFHPLPSDDINMTASKRIAFIVGSTRSTRIGPHFVKHIHELVKPLADKAGVAVDIVDVADQKLPIYDEPAHPAGQPAEDPTPHYANEVTRNWSSVVRKYDAFTFFTPEYNGSIPAGLKNAIDYLFYEWAGKPASIVSYGGGSGKSAASHLSVVLRYVKLQPVATIASFKTSRETLTHFTESNTVSPKDDAAWKESGSYKDAETMFSELLEALKPKETETKEN